MTGKASADDFQVQDFLKKKKKKKQKHKEYYEEHENYESTQNAEVNHASPLIYEDQAAQNGESCKKKKKKTHGGEKKQTLLDNWCVRLERKTGDDTDADAFQKKKKKSEKKWKHSDNTGSSTNIMCFAVKHQSSDDCQEGNADYTFLKEPAKKKRKKKLPEENEVCEPPASETDDKNDNEKPKKKKKKSEKKWKHSDNTGSQTNIMCFAVKHQSSDDCQEGNADYTFLKEPAKKKRKKKLPEENEVCEPPASETDDKNDNEKPKKKKKKSEKKWKHSDNTGSSTNIMCFAVKHQSSDDCQKGDTDYTFLKEPAKKKRKKKLPEENEVCEPPASETDDKNDIEKPKKKKKKSEKKWKHSDSAGSQTDIMCFAVKHQSSDDCQEGNADYTFLKEPAKKKRKKKLPEENEVCEPPASETDDKNDIEKPKKKKKKSEKKWKHSDSAGSQTDIMCFAVKHQSSDDCQEGNSDYTFLKEPAKKKRKKKLPEENEVCEPPASETDDKNDNEKPKKKKKKKKRHSCTEEMPEDTDVTVDQSVLSSPEQNRQREEDAASPSPPEEARVAKRDDSDCDMSVKSEDAADEPASRPQETPKSPRSRIKSRAYVNEETSSESEEMTSELLASTKVEPNSPFTEMAASDELNLHEEVCLGSVTGLGMDLESVKQELEEFIPHVRTMSDYSVRKIAGRDLTRFREFKEQGIAVKFGRFSQKENDQLRKNIEEFLSVTAIDSAEKLLFTSRYPEEKESISRLKVQHGFCEKLSEGIPRPWRLIYYRARKMFDPHNYKGRYTEEEKEKLKKYHALHGNDWKKISEMMSRSNLSVAMKYSEIKSAVNHGPWTKEEIHKLMCAVEEVFRRRLEKEGAHSLSSSEKSHQDLLIDREKLYEKLPWTEIEAKVGTRYWRQCKQKWSTILTNRMTRGQQLYMGIKGIQAKINLIKRLYEMKVEDADEVNWEELCSTIGDVPKTYVREKFYKLKVTSVPLWQQKTFSEIIDYLYEKKLPELEKMLAKKAEHLPSDNSTARKQKAAFRLSDIFYNSEESDQLTALKTIPGLHN